MSKPVFLTEVAEKDIEQITDYLFRNWGNSVCDRFLDCFEKTINSISLNPRKYRMIYKKESIRKCILTKQNTIFYRERKNKIEILAIFDTLQNPEKLALKIKKSPR